MTIDLLTGFLGVAFSLIFEYFPIVAAWFEGKPENVKKLLQVGAAAVIALAMYGLSCAGLLGYFTCDVNGLIEVARLVGVFLITNQTTHKLTKKATR